MKSSLRLNIKYLLLLLVFCGLIPHVMLSLLQITSGSDKWSPAEIESYSNFFVCQWIPFWMVFIGYLRVQKLDNYSPIPAILAALILLTYLPRFSRRSVMTMALAIALMLVVECSALLKNAEKSENKVLAAIAADRSVLRAFCFWSLVVPAVIFISCEACTWDTTVVSPFQMLPIPAVLLAAVFRHQKNQPPTIWGAAAMLAVVPLSLFLVTIGPMEKFKGYHLMSLGLGFAIVFLMLTVYNVDHWKKKVNPI